MILNMAPCLSHRIVYTIYTMGKQIAGQKRRRHGQREERRTPGSASVTMVGTAFHDSAALLLLQPAEGAALVRVRVPDDAVDLAPLVVIWQVLCNRKTFRIAEEQSVAILVLLHLLAGADPLA